MNVHFDNTLERWCIFQNTWELFGSFSNIRLCRLLFRSTASTGSSFSSQRTQRNSWSERWSSPTWTTANQSWLDSELLQLNRWSMLHFLSTQILPCDPPPIRDLHWLPFAACIRFKTMVPAFMTINGTAPIYLQTLVRPHAPAQAVRSTTSAGWLVPPSLRANKGRSMLKSWLFSVQVPQWWNELPTNVRTAESHAFFRKRLKTRLFRLHLDPA